jgi:hypothetical protein
MTVLLNFPVEVEEEFENLFRKLPCGLPMHLVVSYARVLMQLRKPPGVFPHLCGLLTNCGYLLANVIKSPMHIHP